MTCTAVRHSYDNRCTSMQYRKITGINGTRYVLLWYNIKCTPCKLQTFTLQIHHSRVVSMSDSCSFESKYQLRGNERLEAEFQVCCCTNQCDSYSAICIRKYWKLRPVHETYGTYVWLLPLYRWTFVYWVLSCICKVCNIVVHIIVHLLRSCWVSQVQNYALWNKNTKFSWT